MTEQREPVRRITLPTSPHEVVDRKYSIKEFVDRTRPGRSADRRLVLDFDLYRRLIDNVRTTIEDKMGVEVSADPVMIVKIMVTLLVNEELLTEHVYEEANSAPTDVDEWGLIRETFAWRLLGRYNRELLAELGEEEGDDDSA